MSSIRKFLQRQRKRNERERRVLTDLVGLIAATISLVMLPIASEVLLPPFVGPNHISIQIVRGCTALGLVMLIVAARDLYMLRKAAKSNS